MIGTVLNIFRFIYNNKTICLLGICVLLFTALGISIKRYNTIKDEANRLENNQEALINGIDSFKTESGKYAVRVTELELSKSEFKKLCSEQESIIKDMNLKVKRLESVSTTVSKSYVKAETTLKDTVLYTVNDTVLVPDTVKHFVWNDSWNKIEGTIKNNKVNCIYSGNDTLTVAVTKVPKKFLFFKWGCKRIDVNLVNQNPSNKIVYNRTVKLK